MEVRMVTLHVDGKPYSVDAGDGRNLLEVCLSLGFNLPYFCWHPAMHSVGACRQCAVKLFRDDKDTRGRIVMSCMTAVADGMRISVDDPEARAFRSSVIEWLMVNHPHDCPICDEGGECHLQDMTVMTGHAYRRYRFTKRTHRNQNLGPFLNHEMNRCIQCYRCVRFYRDYAGGRDFTVLGWHDNVYFGRHADGTLENEFSGNLAEVCPTGVFTDKTLKRHYTRKWDLQTSPSVCHLCGVGCDTTPGERYGELRRVRPRFNGEVNAYFLCDRGRYGYEFVNAPSRIRSPLLLKNGALTPVPAEEAVSRAASLLATGRAIGIGSPRASLETNFALRHLVGADNFYLSIPDRELELHRSMADVLARGPAHPATNREASEADAVLVLGEDVWNTAPILALNLRQASRRAPMDAAMRQKKIAPWDDAALREAVQEEAGPFFIATPEATGLDPVASSLYHDSPEEIARVGFAVAHELDPSAPSVPGLSEDALAFSRGAAEALKSAERPLVVTGSGLGSIGVIRAASNIARALRVAKRASSLCLVFPEADSAGVSLMSGKGIDSAIRAVAAEKADTVVVAETDIVRRAGTAADALFASGVHVIAMDHTASPTTSRAEVVFPAATFSEGSGTLVSAEGRAQRFFAVFTPPAPVQESWRWLGAIAVAAGKSRAGWSTLDEIISALGTELPVLAGIRKAAPSAAFRINGQMIPRKAHRESGRTAVTAHLDVHEPKPADDPDSPLAHSMEGRLQEPPAPLVPRFWAPGWNSDQAVNKFQSEVGGPLHGGDPGVRLFEGASGAGGAYFTTIPAPFRKRTDALLVVPRHYVFGSEELSLLSSGIAERAPRAHIAVSRADAARLGLAEGGQATVIMEGAAPAAPGTGGGAASGALPPLPVVIRDLPEGVASLPFGLPGLSSLALPGWARVAPAGGSGSGAESPGRNPS